MTLPLEIRLNNVIVSDLYSGMMQGVNAHCARGKEASHLL